MNLTEHFTLKELTKVEEVGSSWTRHHVNEEEWHFRALCDGGRWVLGKTEFLNVFSLID